MKCPNCKCEIGNLVDCPYCGVHIVRRTEPPTRQVRENSAPTVPVRSSTQPERERYTRQGAGRSPETVLWVQLSVCLLAGIFVLEFIQLLLQLL